VNLFIDGDADHLQLGEIIAVTDRDGGGEGSGISWMAETN